MTNDALTTANDSWINDVLSFWFEELDREAWFKVKSAELDQRIRDRYLALHERLHAEGAVVPIGNSRAALARIIVLDQFARNIFRDTPRAFASDAIALTLAQRAVDAGLDAALPDIQRVFFYLPFEHSEDPAVQVRSVELISALGDDDWTKYALAHKRIIDRFGRFPHRNAILGRASTPEEIAFLETPMSSF